jgi:Peptidase propeptide and YPEB domain
LERDVPARWARTNFLIHRWVGIVLGTMVFAWFLSGVVLMYYPYPAFTPSALVSILAPLERPLHTVGFVAAFEAVRAALHQKRAHPLLTGADSIVGGRLRMWNGHLTYELWHQRGPRIRPIAMVDAITGTLMTPIDATTAAKLASEVIHPAKPSTATELLPLGDHYLFRTSSELEQFPVYRVDFSDSARTSVYVGRDTGHVFGTADRLTRFTTWCGTVPHWLYFIWLYQHRGLWTWLNIILPATAVIISLTGIILGLQQVFPLRHRQDWRISRYNGVSKWHHVAGLVFGVMVFTWTLSGVLEMFGGGNEPRDMQAEAVRAGPIRRGAIQITEAQALTRLHDATNVAAARAVDLVQLEGRPAYDIQLGEHMHYWVDAADGTVRGVMSRADAEAAVYRIVGKSARVAQADLIIRPDAYYYARHGREVVLPAWRVSIDNEQRSTLYFDAVSGQISGYVDRRSRVWRWIRDAVHTMDLPGLVNLRPAWDLVMLSLLIGGLLSSSTGVWLILRRLRRIVGDTSRSR